MKCSSPKVSVIIPTYNRLWALPEAIKSVLDQTFSSFELIIVDDGSTDGTEKWVKEKCPSAKYIKKENGGVSSARNRGIEKSRGRYIAFLDSDDRWLPEKLERQIKVMDSGHAVCYTDEIWIRNRKRVNPRLKHKKYAGDIFLKSLPLVIISPSSVMIESDIFDEIGLFDEELLACEDYDLWLRLTSRYPVYFVDEPLIIKYGGHDDQLSKKYWGLDTFRIYALEKILSDNLTDDDRIEAVIREIIKKARIILKGAENRGNKELANLYDEKIREYERKLSDGT